MQDDGGPSGEQFAAEDFRAVAIEEFLVERDAVRIAAAVTLGGAALDEALLAVALVEEFGGAEWFSVLFHEVSVDTAGERADVVDAVFSFAEAAFFVELFNGGVLDGAELGAGMAHGGIFDRSQDFAQDLIAGG